MTDAGWSWKKWWKGTVAAAVVILVPLVVLIGMRRPWIKPLPGVRIEMTRPFVREADLSSDSAFRLLLAAVEAPVGPPTAPSAESFPIWSRDWSDALLKFKVHPWPAEPPPATAEPPTEPDAPWTLAQYEDIERLVRLYEPKMAEVDRALAAPDPQVPTADRMDSPDKYLTDTRQLVRWLAVSAQYRAAHGDYAGSCRDLERILGLGNFLCRGGNVINNLTGFACSATAASTAYTIALGHDLPAPVLRRMAAALLAADDEAEPLVEAMRAEAVTTTGAMGVIFRQASIEALSGVPGPARGSVRVVRRLLLLLLHMAGSAPEDTGRNLGYFYQHLVQIADQPYSAAVQKEYDDFADSLNAAAHDFMGVFLHTRDPMGLLLVSMLASSPGTSHRHATERDAALRGMALFLAIQAYRKEHGEVPETLDQLVPDYLPRVPLDAFDGKPFRYLHSGVPGLPTEAWAAYSVGTNFTDDGGSAHSVGMAQDKIGPNLDLVWPSQDYPPAEAGEE